jgi:pimeloyl-ACP methyl ester carboxylesterase
VDTLEAPDGTTIAYEATGTGPPLVLVMGAFCDRSSTATLTPLLAGDYTVYEYDRRGRGDSTEVGDYSVEREVADLAALVAATGGAPFVFGHSSGGCLALEAAARGVPMTGLAVYEPPYTAQDDRTGGSTELLDRVRDLIGSGDRDGAAAAFMAGAGTPADVVAMVRNGPGWPRFRDLAPTLVHDLTLTHRGVVPRERLSRIGVPTLAVSGALSPDWAATSCAAVTAAIPGARHLVLDGQTHAVADEVLASLLRECFRP